MMRDRRHTLILTLAILAGCVWVNARAGDLPTYAAWLAAGKPLPEGMVYAGGTLWFDEMTGRTRSPEAVYAMIYGKPATEQPAEEDTVAEEPTDAAEPAPTPVLPPRAKPVKRYAFPAHWGAPPRIQTRDYRRLPGDYGMGSTTLANWIRRNMAADAAKE